MKTRIVLEEIAQDVDSLSGELVDVVSKQIGIWAEMRQPKNANIMSGVVGGEVGLALQSFVIRYRIGIDMLSHRLKDKDGYIWRIVDVPKMIGNRQGLELVCQWTGKK